jgi:hypothetical protein
MGQIRHGSATTTHAIRAAIQRSQATNAALSRQLGINVKTVAKCASGRRWKTARRARANHLFLSSRTRL